jgi:L,D-transpeptidase ErfK/SrfK
MLPEDVETFFEKVSSGTPVRLINEPYKVGRLSGALYLEAHLPLEKKAAITEGDLTPLVKLVEAQKERQYR